MCLDNMNLSGAKLQNVNLGLSRFHSTTLKDADLSGALFGHADDINANSTNAKFAVAYLVSTARTFRNTHILAKSSRRLLL